MRIYLYSNFKKIYLGLPLTIRVKVIAFIFLVITCSIAEFISLGAIIPFLAVFFNVESIQFLAINDYINYAGDKNSKNYIYLIGLIFCVLILISSLLKMYLLFISSRLSSEIGSNFSKKVFTHVLYIPYLDHINISENVIIVTLTSKIDDVIFGFVQPYLVLIANVMLFISILSFIIILSPKISIISIVVFGFFYLFIAKLSKKKLDINGKKITINKNESLTIIRDALGGFRDILLDGTQKIFINKYNDVNISLRDAQGKNIYIASSPRFVIEAIGMLLIVSLALYMDVNYGASNSIALLGGLALAAQRVLPILQQIFSSWSSIRGCMNTCKEVFGLLELSAVKMIANKKIINFQHLINFNSISFKYPSRREYLLQNINLEILKGSRVGVIGKSGVGKSTFLDILMGLVPPTAGSIYIDNEELTIETLSSWKQKIAHVPQSVFLIDTSFAENIAFGIKKHEIDLDRVKKAAAMANINDFIEKFPLQYLAEVGGQLSGGQRQRIGIARALYKNSSILVFDEATSALDDQTTNSIMKTIYELPKYLTIFIASHRLNTLHNCDFVIHLNDGKADIIQSFDVLYKYLHHD